jgi:hypothetical protein
MREDNWPVAPPSPVELPEGEYVAAYRGVRRGQWFGQERVRLDYEIVEPANLCGVQVPLFCTCPSQGRVSPRSKYYELWSKANGGFPRRGDRMSPRVFKGYWRVRVSWSQTKSGAPGMPIVTELIERTAGGVSQ